MRHDDIPQFLLDKYPLAREFLAFHPEMTIGDALAVLDYQLKKQES